MSGGGKKTSIGDAKLLKGRDRFRFPLLYADPLRPALDDEELKTRQKVIIRINTVKKLLLPNLFFRNLSWKVIPVIRIDWMEKKSTARGLHVIVERCVVDRQMPNNYVNDLPHNIKRLNGSTNHLLDAYYLPSFNLP